MDTFNLHGAARENDESGLKTPVNGDLSLAFSASNDDGNNLTDRLLEHHNNELSYFGQKNDAASPSNINF